MNANHLGFKVAEAPIVLNPQRRYGRIGTNATVNTAWDTLVVWYRMYFLRYYDRIDYHRRKNMLREFRRGRNAAKGLR
jgi:hypothetical protein